MQANTDAVPADTDAVDEATVISESFPARVTLTYQGLPR